MAFARCDRVGKRIAQASDQESCVKLANRKLDKVTITSAVYINDPQGFALPATPGMFGTPRTEKLSAQFCRVTGYVEPVKLAHRVRSLDAARGKMEQQILWRR